MSVFLICRAETVGECSRPRICHWNRFNFRFYFVTILKITVFLVFVLVALWTMISLAITGWSDPGIIPRLSQQQAIAFAMNAYAEHKQQEPEMPLTEPPESILCEYKVWLFKLDNFNPIINLLCRGRLKAIICAEHAKFTNLLVLLIAETVTTV